MISAQFIHKYHEYDDLDNYIIESNHEIDSLMDEYYYMYKESSLLDLELDYDLFEEKGKEKPTKNVSGRIEEKKISVFNSIIEKLGEQVITIIEKVKGLIDKVINFFKEKIMNKKTDIQKVEELCKKYPNHAKKIQMAITSGDLDIKDYKTMKDLMDGTSDILDKINKGKLDRSGAEKAFEKLQTKWDKFGKPVIAVVSGVTAALSLSVLIAKVIPEVSQNILKGKESKAQLDEFQAMMRKEKRAERLANGGPDEVGLAKFKNSIITKCCNMISANTKKQDSLIGRISNCLDGALKKLMSSEENDDKIIKKSKKIQNNLINITNRRENAAAAFRQSLQDAAKKKENDEAPKRAEETEIAKQKAKLKFDSDNTAQIAANAEKIAKAQEIGKRAGGAEYTNNNRDTVIRQAKDLSKAQQTGKTLSNADNAHLLNIQAENNAFYAAKGQRKFNDMNPKPTNNK